MYFFLFFTSGSSQKYTKNILNCTKKTVLFIYIPNSIFKRFDLIITHYPNLINTAYTNKKTHYSKRN